MQVCLLLGHATSISYALPTVSLPLPIKTIVRNEHLPFYQLNNGIDTITWPVWAKFRHFGKMIVFGQKN